MYVVRINYRIVELLISTTRTTHRATRRKRKEAKPAILPTAHEQSARRSSRGLSPHRGISTKKAQVSHEARQTVHACCCVVVCGFRILWIYEIIIPHLLELFRSSSKTREHCIIGSPACQGPNGPIYIEESIKYYRRCFVVGGNPLQMARSVAAHSGTSLRLARQSSSRASTSLACGGCGRGKGGYVLTCSIEQI